MSRIISAFVLSLALVSPASAQSTAINGTLEGTVKDAQGAVLPGVTVTVANIDTGDQRVVVTNERGLYRAPLLSLGTYRIIAELQGFKKFEQTGVSLRAGQTAVIDIGLTVGALAETILVTADAPLIDLAKIEQGRTLSEQEIKTLPLTSRNPYASRCCSRASSVLKPTSSGCPALPPTARCCASTTRWTAATTRRRIAPACARCRCRK